MAGTKVSSHVISDNIALGGSPTTTTQSASDNSTKLATTAYVTTAISNLADSAPSTLNTLNELAAALGDDANFSTTVTNSLAGKVALSGSGQTIADSANLTLDAAGDIILDADGGDITCLDAGTAFVQIRNQNPHVAFQSNISNGDIRFIGSDGGSDVTALTLDMSEAGFANFNSGVKINGDSSINRGNQTSGELLIGGTTDGGFVDFDGTALQLNTQRDPNTGTFINTSKSNARIELVGADGDAHIKFRTTASNNTSATERMRIDKNGNVSIGHGSPSHRLHVIGGDNDAARVRVHNSASGQASLDLDNSEGYFRTFTDAGEYRIYDQTDGVYRMRIDTSGKVAIGSHSPGANLHVRHGSGHNTVRFEGVNNNYKSTLLLSSISSGDGGIQYDASGNLMYLFSYGRMSFNVGTGNISGSYPNNERLRIEQDGKIGIGCTPSYKFDVYGTDDITMRIHRPSSGLGINDTCGIGFSQRGDANTSTSDTRAGIFSTYNGSLHLCTEPGGNLNSNPVDHSALTIDGTAQNVGIGITSPSQRLVVGTTTNYDPPGLGNSNAHFSILKKDSQAAGDYGLITGVSSDGNVWQQVQRVDNSATAYHLYLQPSGGNVAIGLRQNYVYVPNPTASLVVAAHRSGTGNVSSYLTHLGIEAIGYAGNNYQLGCIDFGGGDTAGAHNGYARIGCSTMVGTNNQETASLEFYVKAPGFGLDGTTHAMKITGKADTSSAGTGTTRNGVLFTYQGIAIDRSWADYPCLNIMNSTPYSSNASTQSELRIHGNNVSSASYPGTSGSDFSVTTRSDGGYATGSDRRRKKNITTIDNALSTVKQLTGKRFQTVNSMNEVQGHVSKNGYKLGFIAQEVEDIIPETVIYHEDEDDGTDNYNSAYAMDYGSVVALLVNAIKEQDITIQDLKSRIETLEG